MTQHIGGGGPVSNEGNTAGAGGTGLLLDTVAPANVGAAAVLGTSAKAAHGDHVHAHGNQTVDTMHALAVAGTSHGFMDKADKTKLDSVAVNFGSFFYGDGSDGPIAIAGTTTETRRRCWTTLDVQAGGVYNTQNMAITCNVSANIAGTMQCVGGAGAASGTAGAIAATGTYLAGGAGGAGGTAGGTAGTSALRSVAGPTGGGAGGNGTGGTGGAGGTSTAISAAQGTTPRFFFDMFGTMSFLGGGAGATYSGGSGGGGGGGDGTAGGGGGAGGGTVGLFAPLVTVQATGVVSADGGAGGTPAAGSRGGGGGGQGGAVFIGARVYTVVAGGVVRANGGVKGTKSGTGTDGVDGSAGIVRVVLAA